MRHFGPSFKCIEGPERLTESLEAIIEHRKKTKTTLTYCLTQNLKNIRFTQYFLANLQYTYNNMGMFGFFLGGEGELGRFVGGS